MKKVLKYKEREALNNKSVAGAVMLLFTLAVIGMSLVNFLALSTHDSRDPQRIADADLISLMTPYEKDAYSAYLRYEQNPAEPFVTKLGTHVATVGTDGCALMWNDSLQELGSPVIVRSSIADLATYQGFIDQDVNDAGFAAFFEKHSGLALEQHGYLLNENGCPRNADGFIDGDALKADAIKASN